MGAAAACALAYRELGDVRLSVRLVNRTTLGVIFGFSWVLFVIQMATLAGDQQTDRLVLAVFSGATAVGIYEAAAKLSGLVSILAGLPTAALMPAASQLDAQARVATLRELYLRGTKYTAAFVLPITVGLIVLAQPLLLRWLGPEFAANSRSAQMLLLVWLVFPNLAVAFAIFVGTGRLRFLLGITSAHAVLNLALSVLLVQPLGVLGVVLGTVITEFVLFPVGMRYTLRVLEVGPAEYVRRVVLPTYPLLLVTALVAWGFVWAGSHEHPCEHRVGGAGLGVRLLGGGLLPRDDGRRAGGDAIVRRVRSPTSSAADGFATDADTSPASWRCRSALANLKTSEDLVPSHPFASKERPIIAAAEASTDSVGPTRPAVTGGSDEPLLVSILTPSYNQARWLPDNLASVACQTYGPIEHIIMDGGSTDGSLEILEAAGDSIVWASEPDKGQADAVNKAFARSNGDIVGWINSDDAYFDCRAIARVVAFFSAHPEIDVAYGHCAQITGDGTIIQVLWAPPFDLDLWQATNPQMQPATFVRRSALSEPMLDDSFHFALDYELWLRLATKWTSLRPDRPDPCDRPSPTRSQVSHDERSELGRPRTAPADVRPPPWFRPRATAREVLPPPTPHGRPAHTGHPCR